MEPKLEPNELSTINNLVNFTDWQEFQDLLKDHKDHLNNQALLELEKRDFEKAYGFRVRAVEANKILQLVGNRLAEIKKEKKDE
jgi:hypothetical protein